MIYERKTKDKNTWTFLWYPFGGAVLFFGLAQITGFGPALYTVSVVYLLLSIMPFITFFRTRNAGFLAVGMFLITVSLLCLAAPPAIKDKSEVGLIPLLLAGMYGLLMVVAYQTFNRKIKWRGQEVFELAGLDVMERGNSFTARPRPSGQVEVSKTEMIRFVEFVTTKLIAFVFQEEKRMVFVLTLPGNDTPYLLGLKKDYIEDTWVAIDSDGQVSVNITEEDYLLFKQDLDFDQLCQSLSEVFIEFLEFSKKGQESVIIDRMNALRLHPFS